MSALADEARLAQIPKRELRALGDRLVALGLADAYEAILARGKDIAIELRAPVRLWHLRRSEGARATALRLFCFDDRVSPAAAAAALGEELVDALMAGGLLRAASDGALGSTLLLSPVDGLLVFADPRFVGGDAVMGPGTTTIGLLRSATPRSSVTRALDLGCGAGTIALHLARHAQRSVGVDVNPRAVTISRLNAALNGIENAEFLVSDLFSAVEGERFDLIASQPPFVARPAETGPATWLFGGARGDEVTLRVVRGLPDALAPAGRAYVLAQIASADERPLIAAMRDALARDDLALLSLETTEISLDEYAAQYATVDHPHYDEGYGASARRLRDHLGSIGVRALTEALLVVVGGVSPITVRIALSSSRMTRLDAARLDARVRSELLLARGRRATLEATFRLGTGIVTEQAWGAPGASPKLALEHATSPLVERTELSLPAYELVSALGAGEPAKVVLARVAAKHRIPADQVPATLGPIVEGALRQGILEVT